MASIVKRNNKKKTAYYLVYTIKEQSLSSGKIKSKTKWLYAGATRQEALVFKKEFEKQASGNKSMRNQKEPISFNQFVLNEFLPWCKIEVSKGTYELTEISMKHLMNFFGDIYLKDITVRDIERWILWRKQTVSNRSVNIGLTYLNKCLKKAKTYGYIEENVMQHVSKLRENSGKIRYFSTEEINLLLTKANPYIKRFIMVGLMTGMRHSEILNLKIRNIDLKNI